MTSFIKTLIDNHFTITYVPSNIDFTTLMNNMYGTNWDDIEGLCIYGPRKIYVSEKANTRATLHEIGHAYDFLSGNISNIYISDNISARKDFVDIYNSPDASGIWSANSYYRSSSAEYFAESFARYLMYSGIQHFFSPDTNNYISNLDKKDHFSTY